MKTYQLGYGNLDALDSIVDQHRGGELYYFEVKKESVVASEKADVTALVKYRLMFTMFPVSFVHFGNSFNCFGQFKLV